MKRILFLIVTVLIGMTAMGQVTSITQNRYGSNVKDAMNTNFSNLQDSIDGVSSGSGVDAVARAMPQDSLGWFNVLSYGAVAGDGSSDTAAINGAIRAARDVPTFGNFPTVFIPFGIYNLDGPIIPMDEVNIEIEKGTYFYFAPGYAGSGIKFQDGYIQSNLKISGGTFFETGTPQYLWKGIEYDKQTSSALYSAWCVLEDITFFSPKWVVYGDFDNAGWANNNTYSRINGKNFIYGVEINDLGSNAQFRGNSFVDCGFQAGAMSKGAYDLEDGPLAITNNRFWDFDSSDSAEVYFVNATNVENNYSGTLSLPATGGNIRKPAHEFENDDLIYKAAKASIEYTQDGVMDTIAYLPNSAIVWDVQIRVNTLFNDSGTDLLSVGTMSNDDIFLNDEDVSSTGFPTVSFIGERIIFNDNYITATYNGSNSDASTGSVRIYIWYTLQ